MCKECKMIYAYKICSVLNYSAGSLLLKFCTLPRFQKETTCRYMFYKFLILIYS